MYNVKDIIIIIFNNCVQNVFLIHLNQERNVEQFAEVVRDVCGCVEDKDWAVGTSCCQGTGGKGIIPSLKYRQAPHLLIQPSQPPNTLQTTQCSIFKLPLGKLEG